MRKHKPHYWVWRRNDGYVSGSAYDPTTWQNHGTNRDGSKTSFIILLDTDDWYGVAVPLIEKEQA